MGRKLALVIGNSNYADLRLAKLKTPEADVRALANLLRAPEVGGFDEVLCLTNPTFAKAQPAVTEFFADKRIDDLLLFYFSGHGVLDDIQNRLYLALKDTDTSTNRLRGTALDSQFVKQEMDNSRARQQVLMLDCCHSGAFARGAKGKGAPGEPAMTSETFGGRGRVEIGRAHV
jgi:uncharacterized caspase-like protein